MRSESAPTTAIAGPVTNPPSWLRTLVIALTAFLTLVDLFAMQAILPTLIRHYDASPGTMGAAVNASTVGMALSSLATSYLSASIDRRRGTALSLILLAIPTAALAFAPDLATFTGLRVLQGVFMAAAFTLMLAYLGEHYSTADGAAAFAAYIAGNVASNFFGRQLSASIADRFGLATTFLVFAALNLVGAALVHATVQRAPSMAVSTAPAASVSDALRRHLADPQLRGSFAIGFLILFAFIGLFTYVNLVLASPPLALGMMEIGFVYFVFAPSVVTTLLAGGLASRLGTRRSLLSSLGIALAGLPLLLLPSLATVLAGLVLFAIGTFAAQAIATGHVGRTAQRERGVASGLYLASYFLGGLVGSVFLGQVFQRFGWGATVLAIGLALCAAAGLAMMLGRDAAGALKHG
jgi:YNFM family putative membrane transporter